MDIKINEFDIEKVDLIKDLPPEDWNFNIIDFVLRFHDKDFFKAFSIEHKACIIGFGNVLLYGSVSWLGNIIVSHQYRNRGIGTKISEYLVDYSLSKGANSLLLIATSIGELLYRKLGFTADSYYNFYTAESASRKSQNSYFKPADKEDFNKVLLMDEIITGEKRKGLLGLYRDSIYVYYQNKSLRGYYIAGLGNGFLAANDTSAGIEMLKTISVHKPAIVIPEKNKIAENVLLENNFNFQHRAPRMVLGRKVNWKPEKIFSRGTGYCG